MLRFVAVTMNCGMGLMGRKMLTLFCFLVPVGNNSIGCFITSENDIANSNEVILDIVNNIHDIVLLLYLQNIG